VLVLRAGHTSIDPWVVVQRTSHTPTTLLSRRKPVQLNQLRHGQHPASKQSSITAAGKIDMQRGKAKVAAAVQPLSVLHIRGKSSLKHTKQLLDCWLQHPDWPRLTVVGPMPNEQITGAEAQRYMAAPNIHVPNPGKTQGRHYVGAMQGHHCCPVIMKAPRSKAIHHRVDALGFMGRRCKHWTHHKAVLLPCSKGTSAACCNTHVIIT